jgi:hypothetical protein
VYKVYFKSISTSDTKTWTLSERNKSKIQAMDMEFMRSTEGKTRSDRIKKLNL